MMPKYSELYENPDVVTTRSVPINKSDTAKDTVNWFAGVILFDFPSLVYVDNFYWDKTRSDAAMEGEL